MSKKKDKKNRFESKECAVNKKLLAIDSQIVVSPQDNLLIRIDKALRLLHEAKHLLEEK